MATYLLTWNPNKYPFAKLDDCITATRISDGYVEMSWSTGVTKRIVEGDRCFLMCLGVEPKGIMGSGFFTGPPSEGPSYHGAPGDTALLAPIQFDVLIHPIHGKILHLEKLQAELPPMNWTPPASGQSIPDLVAGELELLWARQSKKQRIIPKTLLEGDLRRVVSDQRERKPEARRRCIEHYGLNCVICDFNFGAFYGEIGEGLIHVHHLKPLSEAVGEREVNPINDLRPVCANCHQVIHRRKVALTLGEMRQAISKE